MIWQLIIAFGICAALLLFCWYVKALLLRPVRPGENTRLYLHLCVKNEEPELERTVRALLWLCENGTLPAELSLLDAGMGPETRRVAQALANDHNIEIWGTPNG